MSAIKSIVRDFGCGAYCKMPWDAFWKFTRVITPNKSRKR